MNKFKQGDRVRRETTDAQGVVVGDWTGRPWVNWDDDPLDRATRYRTGDLRPAPLTVREAAAALADNVATDPGGVTDTQARLLDDLRAALDATAGDVVGVVQG